MASSAFMTNAPTAMGLSVDVKSTNDAMPITGYASPDSPMYNPFLHPFVSTASIQSDGNFQNGHEGVSAEISDAEASKLATSLNSVSISPDDSYLPTSSGAPLVSSSAIVSDKMSVSALVSVNVAPQAQSMVSSPVVSNTNFSGFDGGYEVDQNVLPSEGMGGHEDPDVIKETGGEDEYEDDNEADY